MKIVYQSIDGKVFDTVDEAVNRDAFVELKEDLGKAPNYMPDYAKEILANYLIDLGYAKMNSNDKPKIKEQETGPTISFGDGRKEDYA